MPRKDLKKAGMKIKKPKKAANKGYKKK